VRSCLGPRFSEREKSMAKAGPDPWSAAPLSRRWDYSGAVMESYNPAVER